jgi:prepilin-type N-terminal cleavage/methylation domain-containing protein
MSSMTQCNAKRYTGFTLIELLIVIAIIAILALIAVPNFLEAQVRSKVSRVYADHRSLASAIEAYTIDWGRPPIGYFEAKGLKGDASLGLPNNFGLPEGVALEKEHSFLTTPVAYVTGFFYDPFVDATGWYANTTLNTGDGYRLYLYQSLFGTGLRASVYEEAKTRGVHWTLSSPGPSRQKQPAGYGRTVVGVPAKMPTVGTKLMWPDLIYDSSNGTMSFGHMIRSNFGVCQ